MNESKPCISVIINCYNGEEFVDSALSTVLAQTFTDWQLIFWDNQSIDGTRLLVQKYQDPRIHYYLAPTHTSLGEARNLAMKYADTEFVCFLDVDDLWNERFLQVAVGKLKNSEYAFCYTNYYAFNSQLKRINVTNRKTGIVTFGKLLESYDIGMSGCIFRKVESINFNTHYSLIEDYDFFLKLLHGRCAFFFKEPLFSYRMHERSLTYSFKEGWAIEFQKEYVFFTSSLLNQDEQLKYKKQLDWLLVRIINAKINENIYNHEWKNVIRLCLGNCLKSPKLLFPLLSVVIGEKRYNRLRNKIQGSTYTI